MNGSIGTLLLCEGAIGDDNLLNFVFLHSSLQDALLDSALGDQSVNCNLTGLAKSMSTIHSLLVDSRIPVGVIEDDCIRG